jgi:hypothetical protein
MLILLHVLDLIFTIILVLVLVLAASVSCIASPQTLVMLAVSVVVNEDTSRYLIAMSIV